MENLYYRRVIDLISWGHNILYLNDLDKYFLVKKFTPSQVNNNVDYHELVGTDITVLLENFDSSVRDKITFETKVSNLNSITLKLHKDFIFLQFSL